LAGLGSELQSGFTCGQSAAELQLLSYSIATQTIFTKRKKKPLQWFNVISFANYSTPNVTSGSLEIIFSNFLTLYEITSSAPPLPLGPFALWVQKTASMISL
jgi:hypothetical protein